jgi:hypothetical protein
MTLFSMGAIFNKDHATCLVGIKTISNTIDTDRILRDEFKDIEKYVKRIIDGYNPLYRSDKMKSMSRKRRHQQTFKRKSIVS